MDIAKCTSSLYTLSIRTLGWIWQKVAVLGLVDVWSPCISALYLCQFGISVRSLFSKSTLLNCVPPGVLLIPCGLHLSTCFSVWWSGILCKWPNHCSLFSLSWCSTGCSSVSLRTSAFRRLCQRVTPSMSCIIAWSGQPQAGQAAGECCCSYLFSYSLEFRMG